MVDLSDKDWRTLVRTIQSGRCILVLGPNASIDSNAELPQLISQVLAGQLAQDLDNPEKIADKSNLAHIAQLSYRENRV